MHFDTKLYFNTEYICIYKSTCSLQHILEQRLKNPDASSKNPFSHEAFDKFTCSIWRISQRLLSLDRPLGRFSHRVVMSVRLSVCLCVSSRNTHFRRSKKHLGVSLILACDDTIFFFFCFNDFLHFSTFLGFWNHPTGEHPTVSQPTVDNSWVSDPPSLPSLLPPSRIPPQTKTKILTPPPKKMVDPQN